jgi:hypothetical protein
VPPILSACQVDGSPTLECPMGGVQSKHSSSDLSKTDVPDTLIRQASPG